jgi:hypothetical protein
MARGYEAVLLQLHNELNGVLRNVRGDAMREGRPAPPAFQGTAQHWLSSAGPTPPVNNQLWARSLRLWKQHGLGMPDVEVCANMTALRNALEPLWATPGIHLDATRIARRALQRAVPWAAKIQRGAENGSWVSQHLRWIGGDTLAQCRLCLDGGEECRAHIEGRCVVAVALMVAWRGAFRTVLRKMTVRQETAAWLGLVGKHRQ